MAPDRGRDDELHGIPRVHGVHNRRGSTEDTMELLRESGALESTLPRPAAPLRQDLPGMGSVPLAPSNPPAVLPGAVDPGSEDETTPLPQEWLSANNKSPGSRSSGSSFAGRGSPVDASAAVEEAIRISVIQPSSTLVSKRSVSKKSATELEQEARQAIGGANAGEILRNLLGNKEVSSLKAWFKHFDANRNSRIDHDEFLHGMQTFGYPGCIESLWDEMDTDQSGEITFEEIDAEEASMWNTFRHWCGSNFSGPKQMITELRRATGSRTPNEEMLNEEDFTEGVRAFGWDQGFEYVLFNALDTRDEAAIAPRELKWLEVEVRRCRQKETAKRRAARAMEHKQNGRLAEEFALRDFKAFLRRGFGPLFRAWRRALDIDASMSVQRAELFKCCRQLNWKGDVRSLWRALDHDGSGVTTLEELDPRCAQLLAQFKQWAESLWGLKPSAAMFRALDRSRSRKLRYSHFVRECEARGFTRKVKNLAVWLDWQDRKYLIEEDFQIFDMWRPPSWLVALPNPQAAEDFKALLLGKCGHYLKAWRMVLDKDNSNSCNWHEFVDAVKHVHYRGDVAGAWMALDHDLTGAITLEDISAEAYSAVVEFKTWADEEFGGVKSAFKVLDADNSGELTYREFRGAVRNFGFTGDIRTLFDSLDQEGDSSLHSKEVAFLDDWDLRVPSTNEALGDIPEFDHEHATQSDDKHTSSLVLDYETLSPGPGAYEINSLIGAAPFTPFAKHCGSWTFSKRPVTKRQQSVGPGDHDPKSDAARAKKPSWSFGGGGTRISWGVRKQENVNGSAYAAKGRASPAPSPGPGAYDTAKTTPRGPIFSMRPRRALMLHPAQRSMSRSEATPTPQIVAW